MVVSYDCGFSLGLPSAQKDLILLTYSIGKRNNLLDMNPSKRIK